MKYLKNEMRILIISFVIINLTLSSCCCFGGGYILNYMVIRINENNKFIKINNISSDLNDSEITNLSISLSLKVEEQKREIIMESEIINNEFHFIRNWLHIDRIEINEKVTIIIEFKINDTNKENTNLKILNSTNF